jgi:phasin
MTDQPFEFPAALRDMAERNVEQARAAYSQFLSASRQVQDMVMRSSGAMTESMREIQARAMMFTQQNLEAGFALASELARARDMKEYFEIQAKHAQRQMQAYTQQAQELSKLVADAARRAGQP